MKWSSRRLAHSKFWSQLRRHLYCFDLLYPTKSRCVCEHSYKHLARLVSKSRIEHKKDGTRLIPRDSAADTRTQTQAIFFAIFTQTHSVLAIPARVLACSNVVDVYRCHMIQKQAKFNYILLCVNRP